MVIRNILFAGTLSFGLLGNAVADLNDGLVAYYPFNGNAIDESGNNLEGQAHNVELIRNRFGHANSAYEFNGETSYIQVKDNELLDFTTAFSFSLWVKQYNSLSDVGYRLIDKETAGTHDGYVLDTHDNSTGQRMRVTSFVNNTQTSDTVYSLNEWHHLVVSFSDGEYNFYLDGIFDGLGSNGDSTVQTNIHDLFIGKAHVGCNGTCGFQEFFNGIIDDVRIYNRVLSEQEVQELYQEDASVCTDNYIATVTPNLDIHLPSLNYQSLTESLELWVELEFYGRDGDKLLWKLSDYGENIGSAIACESDDTIIVSPNLDIKLSSIDYQLLNGTLSLWANFEYYGQGSQGELLWKLIDYGENQ